MRKDGKKNSNSLAKLAGTIHCSCGSGILNIRSMLLEYNKSQYSQTQVT